MDRETFERTLRTFRWRTPFLPFLMDLVNGTRLVVDEPEAIGFGEGNVGYIGPDGSLSIFNQDEVSQITSQTD